MKERLVGLVGGWVGGLPVGVVDEAVGVAGEDGDQGRGFLHHALVDAEGLYWGGGWVVE